MTVHDDDLYSISRDFRSLTAAIYTQKDLGATLLLSQFPLNVFPDPLLADRFNFDPRVFMRDKESILSGCRAVARTISHNSYLCLC